MLQHNNITALGHKRHY